MASFDDYTCSKMKDAIGSFRAAQDMRPDWSLILDDEMLHILEACSRALECAMDALALPFLALVAAQMGNSTCRVNSDWIEPLKAWFIVIARRGEKKTSVCNRLCEEVQSKKHDENANSETYGARKLTKIRTLNELLTRTCDEDESNCHYNDSLVMVDNLERHISKHDSVKNLQTLFQPTAEASGCARNFVGMCQAQDISELIISLCSPDSLGNIDRFVVCCASDFDVGDLNNAKYIPLFPTLKAIREAHDVAFREYVLSEDAEEEFHRIRRSLHDLKRQYHYDEIRWGCINHTPAHVIHLSTILSALANRGNQDRQSFVIGSRTITKSFLFVLELLRQKFLLIPYTFQTESTDMQFLEILLSTEHMRYVKTMIGDKRRERAASNEVIEITLNGNDQPVARIIPKQVAHSSTGTTAASVGMPEYESSDRNLLREGYTEQRSSQEESRTASTDVPTASQFFDGQLHSNIQEDDDDDVQNMTTVSTNVSPNQPIFPDRMMVPYDHNPKASQREQLPPPPLKIRPPQVLSNRPKVAAPKRVVERVRNNVKNDIYTCSDELFVHQCTLKIKKCMLTPGNIITSSYACQYRLFPPVPLVQRTSSPRTTHPSWAAVKFFERLQKLGFGEVLVFRSQSIKFRKKPYDDMSEETRALLRSIGVEEEDYRDALTRTGNMDIRPGSRDYHEYATMIQNGAFLQK